MRIFKLCCLALILFVQVEKLRHMGWDRSLKKSGNVCVSWTDSEMSVYGMLFRRPYTHWWKPRFYDYGPGLAGCICDNTPTEAKGETLGRLGYSCPAEEIIKGLK